MTISKYCMILILMGVWACSETSKMKTKNTSITKRSSPTVSPESTESENGTGSTTTEVNTQTDVSDVNEKDNEDTTPLVVQLPGEEGELGAPFDTTDSPKTASVVNGFNELKKWFGSGSTIPSTSPVRSYFTTSPDESTKKTAIYKKSYSPDHGSDRHIFDALYLTLPNGAGKEGKYVKLGIEYLHGTVQYANNASYQVNHQVMDRIVELAKIKKIEKKDFEKIQDMHNYQGSSSDAHGFDLYQLTDKVYNRDSYVPATGKYNLLQDWSRSSTNENDPNEKQTHTSQYYLIKKHYNDKVVMIPVTKYDKNTKTATIRYSVTSLLSSDIDRETSKEGHIYIFKKRNNVN
ncbi:MAG: hypothetical protein ACRCV0_03930 [Brevinema sp.]